MNNRLKRRRKSWRYKKKGVRIKVRLKKRHGRRRSREIRRMRDRINRSRKRRPRRESRIIIFKVIYFSSLPLKLNSFNPLVIWTL
jgi:hypothetical protein